MMGSKGEITMSTDAESKIVQNKNHWEGEKNENIRPSEEDVRSKVE